uniref:Murine leukemia virus integrase C-terminal domain-containing protein n=1 Tax=Sphaeramia orbicularis TaxID=375764 RepID=A0A672YN98_9TELE
MLPTHQPGDHVLLKSLKAVQGEPRYRPPVQIILTTRTAVKVNSQPQWIHASWIERAPEMRSEGMQGETEASETGKKQRGKQRGTSPL